MNFYNLAKYAENNYPTEWVIFLTNLKFLENTLKSSFRKFLSEL